MTLTKAALTMAIPGLVAASLTFSTGTAQAAPAPAPLLGPSVAATDSASSVIADSYVVVLKDDAALKAAGVTSGSAPDVVAAAATRGSRAGGTVVHRYTHVLRGYSAKLSAAELSAVRLDPAVKYVQRDTVVRSSDTTIRAKAIQKTSDFWGLDRIDQHNLPLNNKYFYSAFGTITAFVVDSGTLAANPDFGTRVKAGAQFVDSGDGRTDCDGHGTFVSGIVGGTQAGVAKGVTLVPVRVLDCDGTADGSTVIAGLDWIRANKPAGASVVNMSLGGPKNQAINDATQAVIDAGITVVVAAGNSGETGAPYDACQDSPSSVPGAIVVAASDQTDRAASFSSSGSCVDLYAPGVDIVSDFIEKDGSTWPLYQSDGTSFAAPHVTGTAALYLQKHPTATPADVETTIKGWAGQGKIIGAPANTPANVLFSLETFKLPVSTTGTDRLLSGQSIVRDGTSRLTSKGGLYYLTYRASDGVLCLFTAATNRAHWCNGFRSSWTAMGVKGSLNSYDPYGQTTFTTNTDVGASTMVVNDKGYIYVKRNSDGLATWSSPH